jgi:hypothetical protein
MAQRAKLWKPTKEQLDLIRLFASVGIDQEIISKVLKVDPKTLRKHCRELLDTAAAKANAGVAGALHKNAMSGNVAAQIFWCKTRLGWRETGGGEELTSDKPLKIIFVDGNTPDGSRNKIE